MSDPFHPITLIPLPQAVNVPVIRFVVAIEQMVRDGAAAEQLD